MILIIDLELFCFCSMFAIVYFSTLIEKTLKKTSTFDKSICCMSFYQSFYKLNCRSGGLKCVKQ